MRSWTRLEITKDGMENCKKAIAAELKKYKVELIADRNDQFADMYTTLPVAFDTETTSANVSRETILTAREWSKLPKKEQNEFRKVAWVYEWTLGIGGVVIAGRNLDQFMEIMLHIRRVGLGGLYIFVHNLGFDFEFIQNVINFPEVFARRAHSPMKAVDQWGNEWRDSAVLSGFSLANLAKNLNDPKNAGLVKHVGDLDYDKMRTPETDLTEEEWGYCFADVEVLLAYIEEQCKEYQSIDNIPLTNTGRIRRDMKRRCLWKGEKKNTKYRKLMKSLTITGLEEYEALRRAFHGGFTHAGHMWSGETITGPVTSEDFSSHYPAQMVARLYPMSKAEHRENLTLAEFREISKTKLIVFDAFFEGLRENHDFIWEHFWSEYDCRLKRGVKVDNGRIVEAELIGTTMTSVDFETFEKAYEWDALYVGNAYIYTPGRLPREFVNGVLDYYEKKTTLKDVPDKVAEYRVFKGYINGCYGMIVTDIVADEIEYVNKQFEEKPADKAAQLEKYNNSSARFLFYPWGVFVTAYARRELWRGIFELGADYHYSDTDSVKFSNYESHRDWFERYNDINEKKMAEIMKANGWSVDRYKPKTIKGVEKPLGCWDLDGCYDRFKSLGAKRYIYETGGELHITIAGVSKGAADYMSTQADNGFEFFADGMTIPAEHTGKLTHTYLNGSDPVRLSVTDCNGHTSSVVSGWGVHLAPTSFQMSLVADYLDYIQGVRICEE